MDQFSTDRLVGMVEDLRTRPAAVSLLSLFFPGLIEEASEEIHFDTEDKPRRIAPFVSPLSEGKLVESQGFNTKSFRPAYIKDKRVFDNARPLKRSMGEALTGALSPQQRVDILLAQEIADQMAMIRRRKEIMASEALTAGTVTVSGEDYPTTVVNFGRDAGLTVNLAGGAAEWDDAGISPVDNIETWMELVLQKSGSVVTDIVLTPTPWRLFKADTKFRDAVDLLRAGPTEVDIAPRVRTGAVLRGTLGQNTRLWTYYDWYVNDAGSEVPIIADNRVIMGSGAIEGVQCHGAIRDHDAGFAPMEFFPKSWIVPDPSVRYLMMQSAPLVVPFRPNASFCAIVT